MEKKLANFLVVLLGKALVRISPSLCDRQVAGPSSPLVVVVQSAKGVHQSLRLYARMSACKFSSTLFKYFYCMLD